jgi:hypothetical protein
MKDIYNILVNVRVKTHEGLYSPNKPLLLLAALARCQQGKDRLAPFVLYEKLVALVSTEFGTINVVFPFGRLPADGVWEIPGDADLYRNGSGDLIRSELLNKSTLGGLPANIYEALSADRDLLINVATTLLKKYISHERSAETILKFGLSLSRSSLKGVQEEAPHAILKFVEKISDSDGAKMAGNPIRNKVNDFISYLNSLHNLGSNGANALAESQATSPYFCEIYAPFPLINKLADTLTDDVPRIVILTGHAGDGKSTVALDVLKRLRGLSPMNPLGQSMNAREDIDTTSGPVSIVKDMSELSAKLRQQWLHQAFSEPGSWLVISNTGPLLSSLIDYAKTEGINQEIESAILDHLARPLDGTRLDTHTLEGLGKEVVILNLTRWDNLVLVDDLLSRLVNHSGWDKCAGCDAEAACPLMLNRKAVRDTGSAAGQRVRWIYQRLSAYEQRLTLRQIMAHLALALTGGMDCQDAFQQISVSTAEGQDRGSAGLELILFSEGFFGYRGGKPWPRAEGLQAVELVRRVTFGAPVGVEFERSLLVDAGLGWADLPDSLDSLSNHWRQRAAESHGVPWRFALRRMAYLFGTTVPGKEGVAKVFLDAFVQSPSLCQLDHWKNAGKLTMSRVEANRLRTACLRILLEFFSGFSAGQFQGKHDTLYLTLRRPDRAVVQPTQLVLHTFPFQDFHLRFDLLRGLSVLVFDKGRAELALTLPLLDYIHRRDAGELSNNLSPIHQAQLDWFRAELLSATTETRQSDSDISLLRAGIDGEVHLHRFFLDHESGMLEQNQ